MRSFTTWSGWSNFRTPSNSTRAERRQQRSAPSCKREERNPPPPPPPPPPQTAPASIHLTKGEHIPPPPFFFYFIFEHQKWATEGEKARKMEKEEGTTAKRKTKGKKAGTQKTSFAYSHALFSRDEGVHEQRSHPVSQKRKRSWLSTWLLPIYVPYFFWRPPSFPSLSSFSVFLCLFLSSFVLLCLPPRLLSSTRPLFPSLGPNYSLDPDSLQPKPKKILLKNT